MSQVILDMSVSLDGYISAEGVSPEEPMGDGGEKLHEWAFGDDELNQQLLEEGVKSQGAVIAGRSTYDNSVEWWGADGPTGPVRNPVFVVTHEPPADAPANGVYTFVTEGIERALDQAKSAADGKNVVIMGGADLGRQFLNADLIDEISIHLVPVLFGGGTRLFEPFDGNHVNLETESVIETPQSINLRFDVGDQSNEGDGESERTP